MFSVGVCKELIDEVWGTGFDLFDIRADVLGIVFGAMLSFLLMGIAHAEQPSRLPDTNELMKAEIQQVSNIFYLRIPIAGIRWCFSKRTDDLLSIQKGWAPLIGQVVSSIPATVEQIQVCNDAMPPTFWIVAKNPSATDIPPTRPLKNEQMVNTWRILVGIPCENETINVISSSTEYHYATNSGGQRGITVCSRTP